MKTNIAHWRHAISGLFLLALLTLDSTKAYGQIFTKITSSVITTDASGCGWIDYNNDGKLDAYLTSFSKTPTLFSNAGDGSFKTITSGGVILSNIDYSGICWGDYNNDGHPDLFVTSMGGGNILLQNLGNGNFKPVSNSGISTSGSFLSANWVDFDNDGYLDLFVTASGTSFSSGASSLNLLYRNDGNGTFTQVTDNSLASQLANSNCAAFADFDNDGIMDVFLTEWGKDNLLFKNNGDGTFTKISGTSVNSNSNTSITASWGDYDNDGYLDLFVGNGSTDQSIKSKNYLFHNNGNGTFTKITQGPVADYTGCTWASAWGDVNNDGYLDLFVGAEFNNESLLFINNGDGTFTADHELDSYYSTHASTITGTCFGDYDDDGSLDLLVADVDTVIYHNNGNSNHWLSVACTGTVSNRSAIGARVKVKATIGGKIFWQIRDITGVNGFRGSDDLRAHFGLGDAKVIDSLVVIWPSGLKTVRTNVDANQFLSIIEEVPPFFLKASFRADTMSGYGPLTVHFADMSRFDTLNPPTSWSWDLNGDGKEESNEKNPTYTYNDYQGGDYDISLTVSNGTKTETVTRKKLIHLLPLSLQNIALNRKATASSVTSLCEASSAVDGSTYTLWASAQSDTQWIQIEFDTSYYVGKVILRWGNSNYGEKYAIQYSQNGADWSDLAVVDTGKSGVNEFAVTPVKAKFLKLSLTLSSSGTGYHLYEFEVYRPTVEGVHDIKSVPSGFELYQNYPNPFNPTTSISYQLSAISHVELKVYDLLGREVATLVDAKQDAGTYVVQLDGAKLSSGVYFYVLNAGEKSCVKKMLMVK
ncbi:MAG: FG-GAP-like repeat-containing protein [Candidatus Kryptoniota bacterium]